GSLPVFCLDAERLNAESPIFDKEWKMESGSGNDLALRNARDLLSQGNAVGAEPILRSVFEANNSDAEANSLLGASLSMQGRANESIPFLERAVGLDPGKASYYYNLGAVVERSGDPKRATDCYRRAVQLDPQYARAAEALQRLYKSPTPPQSEV